jgi:photosystem II stability/assembly factor-like uncharacterized protein
MIFYDNDIFIGSGHGVYQSTDMGETWKAKNIGLNDSIVQALYINDNYQLAGTDHGIYLSTNMGKNWQAKTIGLPKDLNVYSITMLNNNIFAGTYGGLYKSTDFGETWQTKTNGLPDKPYILTFFVVGNNIFAGDDTYGVFLSTDNGENWIAKNEGFKNLYKAKLIDLTTDVKENTEITTNIIYPNPARDCIVVQPSEGFKPSEGYDIQIFDMLGEIVLKVEQTPPSVQKIDVSKLSSGIYFIKIGNRVEKFLKM